jgi:hypothetical protein
MVYLEACGSSGVDFRIDQQSGLRQEGHVAEHAEASGPLALSRRRRDVARMLPRTTIGSRAVSAASVLPRRPAQPAEIAQARVFERLLRAECAELQGLAHRMAGDKYQQPEPDDARPSEELTQIRARIDEVHGLLRALQGRFPHSASDGDR